MRLRGWGSGQHGALPVVPVVQGCTGRWVNVARRGLSRSPSLGNFYLTLPYPPPQVSPGLSLSLLFPLSLEAMVVAAVVAGVCPRPPPGEKQMPPLGM